MGVRQAAEKLRSARDEIARIAAQWQAGGHDTTPLAEPLVRIQEAIAELESRDAAEARSAPEYLAPSTPRVAPTIVPSLDS